MSGIHGYHPTEEDFNEWLEENPGCDWEDYIDHLEGLYDAAVDAKIDAMREEPYPDEDE